MLDRIKNLSEYRGQLYKILELPSRSGKIPEVAEDFRKIYDSFSILWRLVSTKESQLTTYEFLCVKNLLFDGKDVCIAPVRIPETYGLLKRLVTLYFLISGRSTILFFPNRKEAQAFKGSLRSIKWLSPYSGTEIGEAVIEGANIFVFTPQDFWNELTLHFETVKHIFYALGLVILYKFDSFPIIEWHYLSSIFRFLNLFSQKTEGKKIFNFLFLGETFENTEQFLSLLSSKEPTLIRIDRGYPAYSIYYWIPPYIFDLQKRVIIRRNFYEELKILVKILHNNLKLENILFFHGFARISISKLQEILFESVHHFPLRLLTDIDQITEEDFCRYDVIISLGIPMDVLGCLDSFASLLKPDGERKVFFLLPEEPISFYFLRTLQLDKISRSNFLAPLPFDIQENKNEARNFFITPLDSIHLKCRHSNYDIVNLLLPSGENIKLPSSLFPDFYFEGALLSFSGRTYEIRESKNLWEAQLVDGPVERIPLIKLREVEIEEKAGEKYDYSEFQFMFFENSRCVLDFLGYKEIDYNSPPLLVKFPEPRIFEKENPVIIIRFSKNTELLHSLVHLLRMYLSLRYKNASEVLRVRYLKNNIVIYPLIKNLNFYELFSKLRFTISTDFPAFAIDLLMHTCPCKEGCPLCLDILDCNEENNKGFSKKETIEFLMHLNSQFQTEFYRKYLEFKYEGLKEKEEAYGFYASVKEKILNVFKDKFGFDISWVPLVLLSRNEMIQERGENILGFFSGDKVCVVSDLTELEVYNVLAHEYTHQIIRDSDLLHKDLENLQNVPFEGRLFSEGAAEWLAFRVLDHFIYKNRQELPNFFDFSEYGEGFELLCWLEDKVGLYGVLRFLKEGQVEIDGKSLGPSEIIKESGLLEKLLLKGEKR